jgi:acyl-CoA hydrolase
VQVHAENPISGVITHTNSAYFVFVALDEKGLATPVPGLLLETDEQRALFAEGKARQAERLRRAGR